MKRSGVTFSQINIVSTDLDASLEFYRRLGVEMPADGVWRTQSGAHHASSTPAAAQAVQIDLDSIAFARIWNTGWSRRSDIRGRVVLGFNVESRAAVDETYADLTAAGHPGLQAPYDAFWGARYAVVEDPDGVAVGIMSPVSAEFRRTPPDVP
jgi:catechol 2,3-dioxygenase-like lactoylglutathione lyase family enzyme